MIRLFAGLALPEDHARELARLQVGLDGARWVAPENLHVTLRFIGEVDEDVAEDLAGVLDTVKGDAFDLTIKGLGTFGRPPHALWADMDDTPPGALGALQGNVESALVRAGLKPESRKFTPHVTLARFRHVNEGRLANYMETYGDLALAPFRVAGFTLFQSHLSHEGAHYERVVEYAL